MADNSNQPGTSTGSSKNISIIVSKNDIKNLNLKTDGNVTINQSTPSTHAPRHNPIDNVERTVDTFIGRKKELSDIKKLFQQYRVVVIAAMGGIGKTQLARKFAAVNADVYRDRYWINAETEAQLLKSFDRLAKKVKVDTNTDIDTVRDTYRSFTEGAALLIFDNVEHVKIVYEYLPTRFQLKDITLHVLITSRWTDWTCDEQIKCYKLQPRGISTSLQMFQRKFEETCIDTMQNEWKQLAEMLGYLPLALQVATSYIYKRNKHNSDLHMVLADYMKQLKEGAAGLLNDPLTEYGNCSIYASMMLTLQQLENKADNVSNVQDDVQRKFAVTIINVVAYMNPDRIYKEDLLKLVDNPENICKLDEALEILTEYSLLNQGFNWGGDTIYSVHRIIQTSIRHNQILIETADKYYIRALKCAFTEDYIPWEVLQYANERASAIADYYKDNPSPRILEDLVKNNAIRAMEALLKLIPKNQIQITIKKHELLNQAVDSEYLSMTQLLWKYGADINQPCRKGYWAGPPLHHALQSENVDIATWLLENGAKPSVRDMEGRNAVHVAIMRANHKIVPTIIKTDRTVVNETNNYGQTPLHLIYYSKNEENILTTTRLLVESGAVTAAVDKDGNTVLHSVTRSACPAAVSLILQLSKDLINIVNKYGETALHVIPYYNTRIDDERILSTIRVLVESGGDLAKKDKWGNTVLHTAATGACAAAVSLIFQENKNLINIVNNNGETALHVIPYYKTRINDKGILSTIRILVESGGDLTKVDSRCNTVLHYAAQGTNAEAVSLILQLNKDLINIKDKDGQTALHVLGNSINLRTSYIRAEKIKQLFAETARVLIMNGLSLDTRDNKGHTLLDTVEPEVKNILLKMAGECNNQLQVRPVKRQELSECCAVL